MIVVSLMFFYYCCCDAHDSYSHRLPWKIGLDKVNNSVIVDLIHSEKASSKLKTFPGPETIGDKKYETIRDLLTAEIDRRRTLHTQFETKKSKAEWTAFYDKSFAPDGLLFNVFRPYGRESVRKFRQNIFIGMEIDAGRYEAQIELGEKPEDLPDVQRRAFKLFNEMIAARDAFKKNKEAAKEKTVRVRSENEHVEELLGLRNGGAVTPSPTNDVAANPASLLGKQPGE